MASTDVTHGGSDAWWLNATGFGDNTTTKAISLPAFLE
jgi:hypothetical protein